MKQILPLLFIGLLFTTGCENFFGAGNDSGDPYAYDMLVNDLDQDLGLSARQLSDSKDNLHNGGDYYPDNASLWRLALFLQENLTAEQKERLLSPPDDLDPHAYSEENDYHYKRLRYHQRMDEFIRSILNSEQESEYDVLIDYKTMVMDELFTAFKAGTMIKEELHLQMMGLMEWFRAAMDKLLMGDQKAILDAMHKEKDDHWRRGKGGFGKHAGNYDKIRQEMYDVLGMTAEQIQTLDSLEESFKAALESLHNDSVNGIINLTPEEYRTNVVDVTASFHEEKQTVFTAKQLEIIEIHRALSLRFMRHSRWGKGR
jgi:hypothetical protein